MPSDMTSAFGLLAHKHRCCAMEMLRVKGRNVVNGPKVDDKAFSVMDYIDSQPPSFIDVTDSTDKEQS